MKKITDAESEADEIIRKAKEEADYTVAAAKKEAADMIAAAGSASRESMKSAEGAGKSEEEKLTVKAMDIAPLRSHISGNVHRPWKARLLP